MVDLTPRNMKFSDPLAAFEKAISENRLTISHGPRYAGDYMYMYTEVATGRDVFKHIDTRKYDY